MSDWQDGFAFNLGEDVALVRQTARSFAQSEVLPLATVIDREHRFPKELMPALGSIGFLGAMTPPEYGGAGLSTTAYACIIEELAAACASTAIIVSAHNSLCLAPLLAYGSEEQKRRFAPDLASGTAIGCFALSEPGCGSDAASLSCTARREGDTFVINGTKNWITNAPVASTCILFATSDSSARHRGVQAFVHPLDLPGITIGKKEDKLGIRGSPTASISYDNVVLSAKDHLLGGDGKGFAIAMSTLNGGRIGVAAQAVGIARAALRDALAYAKERKTFGKAIAEHQSIQNYLADMNTRIDAARYLTLGAAQLKDDGKEFARQAAMAKLFASEVSVECALRGIQIHGGYGYVTDFPAERHLRDAKITEIYEGTSEIQRIVIATDLVKKSS